MTLCLCHLAHYRDSHRHQHLHYQHRHRHRHNIRGQLHLLLNLQYFLGLLLGSLLFHHKLMSRRYFRQQNQQN
jgi:hypothetical protein